jgi:hypothetical protein
VISCNLILDLVFSCHYCHDKLGFGSLYTKKKRPQSLFQSWITNGNIEQLPFIITGATGTAVNITSIPAISWWAIAYW